MSTVAPGSDKLPAAASVGSTVPSADTLLLDPPLPPSQIAAAYEAADEEADAGAATKARNKRERVEVVRDDEGPVGPPGAIAAAGHFEEGGKKCKTRPETTDDGVAPSADAERDAAAQANPRRRIASSAWQPTPSLGVVRSVPPRREDRQASASNPTSVNQQQQSETSARPSGPDGAESVTPSVPLLEATLVPDEPDPPMVDAVAVRQNEHETIPQPALPWWRQHQKIIMLVVLVLLLVIVALAAIMGTFLLSQNDDNSESAPEIRGTPSAAQPAPPTVAPSVQNPSSLSTTGGASAPPTKVATLAPFPTKGPKLVPPSASPSFRPVPGPTPQPPPAPPSVKPTLQPTRRPTKRLTPNPTRNPTCFPTSKPVSSAASQISQSSAVKLVPSEDIARLADVDVTKNAAIHGDTAVVGAPANDDEKGAVFVFVKGANGEWSQQSKLVAPDGANGDWFGVSVGIFGDTIAVGAYQDDDSGEDSGSAHVFVRVGVTWTHRAKLLAPDGAANDYFGKSVGIYQDTVVVGAYHDDDNGDSSGSAQVFVRSGATWSHQTKLLAPDGAASDFFGVSVAIYEDTIVIGAYQDDDKGWDSGSAHVFVRNGATWIHQAKLLAPDGAADDWFGWSVAIYHDTIVVGADGDDDTGENSGSAHAFVREGADWSHQAKLLAPDGSSGDWFGICVAIHGNLIIAGAHRNDDSGEDSGSAHVFVREGADWSQQVKVVAPDAAAYDEFGLSVAIDNGTALVGSKTSACVFSD